MAEGADPDADKDRHKDEYIRRWLKGVEMASYPRVSDGGLIFNPDSTSSYAHTNLIGIATTNPVQAPLPSSQGRPHPTMPHPSKSSPHTATQRSQSFSLWSRPIHTSSLSRRQVPQSSTDATKTSSIIPRRSPLAAQTSSCGSSAPHHEPSCGSSAPIHKPEDTIEVAGKGKQQSIEEKRKETGAEEQQLRELRSLIKTRQSSLSPLPVPTAQPSLPTFNLSEVGLLPAKRDKLKKKLPTITGVRTRKDQTSVVMKLIRATTSPSELSFSKTAKSAPCSPKPTRAYRPNGGESREGKEEVLREVSESPPLLERQKSFSHDDIKQLKEVDQLNVGGVSPAQSRESCDGDAPSSQHSLVVEEGTSDEGEGKRSDDSIGKMESFLSDEKSDNEGSPLNQSQSLVDADRAGDISSDQSLRRQWQPDKQLVGRQEDQKKVAMCPISPLPLSSQRTPHSPLIRQRPISRSPSPTNAPSTSLYHKRDPPHSGTESGNVISKQKLKLLSENRTFSFDTSEDTDLNKLSKQPKFLRSKAMKLAPTCPISPPPLLSPPSSHCPPGNLSQFLAHHSHSRSDNAINQRATSPTQLTDQSDLWTGGHVIKNARSKSPILSEQHATRRGSTPVTLSLTKTPQVGPFSSVASDVAAKHSNRSSSLHHVVPSRPLLTTSQKLMGMTNSVGMTTELYLSRRLRKEEEERLKQRQSQVGGSEMRGGSLDKSSVNRQDSGLGTLSTTSNKCDFRM